MAPHHLLGRRFVGILLLAVFAALTVQAGFFHSCDHSDHHVASPTVGGPEPLQHDDQTVVCASCLLTRILAAGEPAETPAVAPSDEFRITERAPLRLVAAPRIAPGSARAPPGC